MRFGARTACWRINLGDLVGPACGASQPTAPQGHRTLWTLASNLTAVTQRDKPIRLVALTLPGRDLESLVSVNVNMFLDTSAERYVELYAYLARLWRLDPRGCSPPA